jgi:hypothetical protein
MMSFNPTSPHPERAAQAWQILVGMAMNRQTTTYQKIARLMYHTEAPGVLDRILEHIAFFCADNGLPPLTSIVVGKSRGTPGDGIPVGLENIDEERENVYQYDWYDVKSPTPSQLSAAFLRHAS